MMVALAVVAVAGAAFKYFVNAFVRMLECWKNGGEHGIRTEYMTHTHTHTHNHVHCCGVMCEMFNVLWPQKKIEMI